ncbi:unnamed protein product [Rotaria sp. Silwood1]|nr:unnamed protein product [Rotaria sp. Silwood1]
MTNDTELCMESFPKISSVTPKINSPHNMLSKSKATSTVSEKPGRNKKQNDLNMTLLKMKHSSPKIDNDAGGKVITNIPVPKDETTPIVINLNVQSPNLASKQEKKKKGLPIVDLHSNKSGQTSLMNMKTKRRSNSFDEQLPKQQHPKHTHKKRIARRSSAGDIDHVRVTHIHAHPIATQTLPIDDIRPSIIENTIRLDDIKKNVQSEPLMETNDSKIYVKTAPSHTLRTTGEPRPSQIDTIHLTSTSSKLNISTASADNNDKNTPKGVHVKHIKMQKKKTYTTTAVTPLQSLIEEEKKETDDHE